MSKWEEFCEANGCDPRGRALALALREYLRIVGETAHPDYAEKAGIEMMLPGPGRSPRYEERERQGKERLASFEQRRARWLAWMEAAAMVWFGVFAWVNFMELSIAGG